MAWRVRWGKEIPYLLEIQRDTGTTPSALANRPILSQYWQFADEVFSELSGSRRYTAGGAANIPFSEFFMWAISQRFSLDDIAEVWEDLRQVDNAWLSAVNEAREAETKGSK